VHHSNPVLEVHQEDRPVHSHSNPNLKVNRWVVGVLLLVLLVLAVVTRWLP
jgi:hypothetical protein